MGQLHEIEPQLKEIGYQIIAISADRPEKLTESIGRHDIGYQLLSDSKMTGAAAFGIAYEVDDKTYQTLKDHGLDIEDASGETHRILPVPSVFVVGTDGVIKFQYVNPDHRTRIDPSILLAAAKASLDRSE